MDLGIDKEFNNKKIEIGVTYRNRTKATTKVNYIPEDIDLKLVLNYWKKEFKCSGSIKSSKEKSKDGKDAKLVQFIELFGNKSNEVKEFLIKEGIGIEENIIIYDKKG